MIRGSFSAAGAGENPYQEGTPDLFFYGIHGVEALFTLMGTGCETVARVKASDAENEVDLGKSPLTLGSLLRLDPEREAFLDDGRADVLLTREYRRPFVVPAEGEV